MMYAEPSHFMNEFLTIHSLGITSARLLITTSGQLRIKRVPPNGRSRTSRSEIYVFESTMKLTLSFQILPEIREIRSS